jgi:sugar lactone lactonase YvrE
MSIKVETLLDGLAFPEGPRWHDGRLFFSDLFAGTVRAVELSGRAELIAEIAERPSGLGWTPDNKLLVVSMNDRKLLRMEEGSLRLHADLAPFATGPCNDMVVDAQGRAFVGNFGFDMFGGAERRQAAVMRVEADGVASIAADGLDFPNGMVIPPDGGSLIVAESYGNRLTRFDLAPDGTLSNRRPFAELPGVVPDGICLDAEGAVWVAHARANQAVRVLQGGRIVETVTVAEGRAVFACALGGEDRRTLFLCTSAAPGPDSRAANQGRIEIARVAVPGAGWP